MSSKALAIRKRMKKRHRIFHLTLVGLLLILVGPTKSFSQTATVPININVNGTLTVSDANNDASSGKNPTINVNLSVTPDLGAAAVTGDANFRIRTNRSEWRLTVQRTQQTDTGPTNIQPEDISLLVTTQAGTNANPKAGSLVTPFNSQTDIGKIPTSRPIDVITGKDKTSTKRDSTNSNNYFQVNTTYSILPDYFYQPGTWKTTITYNLISP